MFQKILVAIDNSAISQQVFDTALSLAKVMEATLMLLQVLSPLEGDTPAVNTQFTTNYSSPGKTIREFACAWGADLIVMGLRNDSDIKSFVMKSVSNYLYHNAHCSVLVVQHPNSQGTQFTQNNHVELST
jgi:nucleotide-binding universal stress UspA family protein